MRLANDLPIVGKVERNRLLKPLASVTRWFRQWQRVLQFKDFPNLLLNFGLFFCKNNRLGVKKVAQIVKKSPNVVTLPLALA